jgi:hypothetical protein
MPANIFRATVTGLSSNASNGAQTNSSGYPTYYCDTTRSPFSIGIGVTVNSTAAAPSWNIEFTDDYLGNLSSNFVGFLASAATWFQHSTLSGQSSNGNSNFAFGISACRLNVTAGASQQTTTVTFIQAGWETRTWAFLLLKAATTTLT